MITTVPSDRCYEYRGLKADFNALQTDVEKQAMIGNGSVFFCIDTIEVYMFDAETQVWNQIG